MTADDAAPRPDAVAPRPDASAPRPYTLVAELTYRCPLSCAYCTNPLDLAPDSPELDTATWKRVFAEAEALGVLQLNLSGGEPLVRDDLEELVAAARNHQLYTNLITSGVPCTPQRLAALRAAGLDSLQLSVQDTDAEGSRRIAGRDCLAAKLDLAAAARTLGLPMTLNVVLHRGNISRVDQFVALAEQLHVERLELANTQYLGWALLNRDSLLPTEAAVALARRVAEAARARLRGKMEILFVRPDYHADRPRACMDGWARRYIVVNPHGQALPCHQASSISTLHFENVKDQSLGSIWNDSPAFRSFRGEAWMPLPCRTCDERTTDFAGCRCQAFALLGDPAATDPVCALSPQHGLIESARLRAATPMKPLALRRFRAVS